MKHRAQPIVPFSQSDGSGHKISITPALRLRAVKHSDFHPCFRERSWWDFGAIFQPMSSRSGWSLCQDRSRPRSDYAAIFPTDLAAAPLGTGREDFPPLSALLIRPLLASSLTGESSAGRQSGRSAPSRTPPHVERYGRRQFSEDINKVRWRTPLEVMFQRGSAGRSRPSLQP